MGNAQRATRNVKKQYSELRTPYAVLFIVGPTASGKSGLAVELAKRLNGEILSADSMQVYKGMNVGTAKPPAKERRGVPHHGIDLIPHTKNFSAFQYYRYVLKTLTGIVRRGKLPIVVGGTGFYIRALLEGVLPQPGADPRLRRKLEQEALKKGGPAALYRHLFKLDRKRALAVGRHNVRRILRALEICLVSGRKASAPVRKSPGLAELGYQPVVIGIHRDRASLYRAINARVDKMFRSGLVREVKRLARKKFSKTAAQGVGYKEVLEHIRSSPGLGNRHFQVPDLKGWQRVKEKIKQTTRHFAKRQWTWFKKEKGIRWVWWPETSSVREICNFIISTFSLAFSNRKIVRSSGLGVRRKSGSEHRTHYSELGVYGR